MRRLVRCARCDDVLGPSESPVDHSSVRSRHVALRAMCPLGVSTFPDHSRVLCHNNDVLVLERVSIPGRSFDVVLFESIGRRHSDFDRSSEFCSGSTRMIRLCIIFLATGLCLLVVSLGAHKLRKRGGSCLASGRGRQAAAIQRRHDAQGDRGPAPRTGGTRRDRTGRRRFSVARGARRRWFFNPPEPAVAHEDPGPPTARRKPPGRSLQVRQRRCRRTQREPLMIPDPR